MRCTGMRSTQHLDRYWTGLPLGGALGLELVGDHD